ncbi:MAG: hypothetical protein LBO75_00975, partial [Bifidobacteriaceae bacterium]|nr:hypothetical protein [Bifidobacteriaceae bacterium]
MKLQRTVNIGLILAGAAAVAIGSRWHRTWGATPEEHASALPGDELIPNPTFVSTRAITFNVPPEKVWPWLVQMGMGRAGWYSYDRLAAVFSSVPTRSATTVV